MAHTINSSTFVKAYNSVADQIKGNSEETSLLSKSLSDSNSDKALDIVETKLIEISKELETISTEINSYSEKITSATNAVNEELKKAEGVNI